jgi:hypothetical protein
MASSTSFQGSQIMIEQTNGHWATGELEHPYGAREVMGFLESAS